MGYHYNTSTLEELNKVCPGTLYLRNAIRKIAADHNAAAITTVDDGEVTKYELGSLGKVSDAIAMALSQEVLEIDDQISINFINAEGKRIGSFFPIYDGPYDKESAPEIVADYQTRSGLEFDLPAN